MSHLPYKMRLLRPPKASTLMLTDHNTAWCMRPHTTPHTKPLEPALPSRGLKQQANCNAAPHLPCTTTTPHTPAAGVAAADDLPAHRTCDKPPVWAVVYECTSCISLPGASTLPHVRPWSAALTRGTARLSTYEASSSPQPTPSVPPPLHSTLLSPWLGVDRILSATGTGYKLVTNRIVGLNCH